MKSRKSCASCGGRKFDVIYDFGKIPLAGSFPKENKNPNIRSNEHPRKNKISSCVISFLEFNVE